MPDITELIRNITPLYNQYKQNKESLSGTQSLILMWEIGDYLKKYIDRNNVAPHNLFRQIYGKSEGKENISQKSYVSREFQGRCFRIRNMFPSKEYIFNQLPGLIDFTSFREAMPFFDNAIYKLKEEEFKQLLVLLNSKVPSSKIIKQLSIQKKAINNITNSRNQKLEQLVNEKKIFIDFYNFIYKLIKENTNYNSALELLGIKEVGLINLISKNLSALAQEGILIVDMPETEIEQEIVNRFYSMLSNLLEPKDEKERRRFRRLIPPERIVRLADIVYSFSSEQQYNKQRNR